MFFGRKKILGIDIGARNIKLAELDCSKNKCKVVSLAMTSTPSSSYEGGVVIDPLALSEVIRQLILNIGSKRKHLAMGLSGVAILVKRISFPRVSEELIEEQLQWEAEQYIPYDINDVIIDFNLLRGQVTSKENMDVMLVVALEETIDNFLEISNILKLECGVLEVSSFALADCFKSCYPSGSLAPTVLLDIGAKMTSLSVVSKQEVIYVRGLPFGGDVYTGEIQRAMSVSFEEAESLKKGASGGGAVPDEVVRIIEGVHESAIQEIQQACDNFSEINDDLEPISEMYITGGGSLTLGLEELLTKKYGAKRFRFADFPFFDVKKISPGKVESMRDFAAIAIGLGMRVVSNK